MAQIGPSPMALVFCGLLVLVAVGFVACLIAYLVVDFVRPVRAAARPPLPLPPEVGGRFLTPVETGMDAAERMTPVEREAFRSWMDGRWPRPHGGEGITR